ncbi:MAG: hypothetical protein WC982_09690 [Advenella sp.]
MGATDAEMADEFGVTEQTINNWKKAHPKFFESLSAGKRKADGKVARTLYQMAIGGKRITEKPMVVSHGGNAGSSVEIVQYEEWVDPVPSAVIFWLKNRRPNEWRDKQDHEHSGSMHVSIEFIDGKDSSD